jgi:NAD(P)-dependent dehydrogenase (short-subunit alcohol dehydrogenase family)
MAGRLADKVCVITGAASGQGRVAAEIFAREGALLALSDVDGVGLQEVAALVRQAGAEPILHRGDLTQEPANEELMRLTLERHGRIDALYNAAGLVRFSAIHETSLDDWRFTLEHELTITFLACKHAIRAMLDRGHPGSIINISSVAGLYPSPRHAAHAATKAGIVGLTRQIAVEYGPRGIRCNAIAPSFLEYGPGQRRIASQTPVAPPTGPLGRHARPEDTAYCALYLASDEASFITGQVLIVDGGTSAR